MLNLRLLLILGLILILPLTLRAQELDSIQPLDLSTSISISLTPTAPHPNEVVVASVEQPGVDLDNSIISWSINGTRVKSGRGEGSVSFTTGNLGSRTLVSVSIQSDEGNFTKGITVVPTEIDILWQGDGYIPPFYRGKSFWGKQGRVTLLAIPHIPTTNGGERNPTELTYRWSDNSGVTASGVGKNILTLTDSVLSLSQNIQVDIIERGNVLATASIKIIPTSDRALIYELNPLYGYMFQKEVGGNYDIKSEEITFGAFPLFFSATNRADGLLEYEWRTDTGTLEAKNTVTYRTPSGAEGISAVTLKVKNKNKVLQSAVRNFTLRFGKEDL